MILEIKIESESGDASDFPELLRHIATQIEQGYEVGEGWEIKEDDDDTNDD